MRKAIKLFVLAALLLTGIHGFAQSYVDLGLPSGTLWKESNEIGYYGYENALRAFGERIPSNDQWQELMNLCKWTRKDNGYIVIGPNGRSIVLPAEGCLDEKGNIILVGNYGCFWSSTPMEGYAYCYSFSSNSPMSVGWSIRSNAYSVRLVLD